MLAADGTPLAVHATRTITKQVVVYNFTVATRHTYTVGQFRTVVHNVGGCFNIDNLRSLVNKGGASRHSKIGGQLDKACQDCAIGFQALFPDAQIHDPFFIKDFNPLGSVMPTSGHYVLELADGHIVDPSIMYNVRSYASGHADKRWLIEEIESIVGNYDTFDRQTYKEVLDVLRDLFTK